jgi:DNA helicase-2/ATP-dependent DNA helicase PcrA
MYATPSRFLEEIDPGLLDYRADSNLKSFSLPLSPKSVMREKGADIFDNRKSSIKDTRDISSFRRGDQVIHNKFGEGLVSATEGTGDSEKVMVYFQGFGAKKLMVKFAGLRKLNS